jgi:hypothetical protein
MALPKCPNPAHDKGRVVRAGWHGQAPHRRQRWLCRPPNGDSAHRFTEELPRQEAEGSHCSECSSALDPWEGQAGAREYAFSARDVAHALRLVATGLSYRKAAQATRAAAGRPHSGVTWGRQHRKRRRNLDGQLVANWVDGFAQVVCYEHGVAHWPERMAVDSVEFRIGGITPRSFHVMVAVGYEAPSFREPRVWLMRPFVRKDQDAWEDFFDLLPGTPRRIVADMDAAIEGAVAVRFPRPGHRPPDFHWSDLHVRRALDNALAPLHGQPPTHPVWQRLERALFSVSGWDRFVHAIQHEDRTGTPLPAAMRWIAQRGQRVRDQAFNRDRGPYSTGAVEAVNLKLATELIGERANRMGNRARAVKLLDLLTVGLNGHANERPFAKAIRIYLEGHRGRPQLLQRPHDDFKGAPSLFT